MLEAVFPPGNLLKTVAISITDMGDYIYIDCTPGELSVRARNYSGDVIANLVLHPYGFLHYLCTHDETVCVDIRYFVNVMKLAKRNDIITMTIQDGVDTVNFMIETPAGVKSTRSTMFEMNIPRDPILIPMLAFTAFVQIPSSQFDTVYKDLKKLGNTLTITVRNQLATFATECDLGTTGVNFEQNAHGQPIVEINMMHPQAQEVNSSCFLRYLNQASKASPLSDRVTIYIGQGQQIIIRHNIPGIGEMLFFVAALIDVSDDEEP